MFILRSLSPNPPLNLLRNLKKHGERQQVPEEIIKRKESKRCICNPLSEQLYLSQMTLNQTSLKAQARTEKLGNSQGFSVRGNTWIQKTVKQFFPVKINIVDNWYTWDKRNARFKYPETIYIAWQTEKKHENKNQQLEEMLAFKNRSSLRNISAFSFVRLND